MPVFITQGRYTQDAVKGMLAKPEDRAETVTQLFAKAGGKMLAYYMTFGEYDFLIVSEGPSIDGGSSSHRRSGQWWRDRSEDNSRHDFNGHEERLRQGRQHCIRLQAAGAKS